MHPNMFPFRFSSVISNVSVGKFEYVFVCLERHVKIRITTVVVLILKYLIKQKNTYSTSAAEALEQDKKSVIS